MALHLAKHEKISLRAHPEFCEAWLHEQISKETSLLGLGELEVVARERTQFSGGRLDLLLRDADDNARYEVEIMLGATDPSHIIRTIEYWDVERRQYPAYDHVAVLVAEEVTSRFLNVMSLLSGSIPLVAIQLSALKVGDQIVLDFVKVLDQRELRTDDETEAGGEQADRGTWETKVGGEMVKQYDKILVWMNETATAPLAFNYKKRHIGIYANGSVRNFVAIIPRKSWFRLNVFVKDALQWKKRLDDAALPTDISKSGDKVRVSVKPKDLESQAPILRELLHCAVKEFEAS